jgi:hypothetical protein
MRLSARSPGVAIAAAALAAAIWAITSRGGLGTIEGPRSGDAVQAVAGDVISRPDKKPWARPGARALIVVGSSRCMACTASKPFSEVLYGHAQSLGIPFYYVFPKDSSSDEAANALAVMGRAVIRMAPAALGVAFIPAFLRVDSRGVIESRWTGTVPEKGYDRILASLVSGRSLEDYGVIRQSDFDAYAKRPDVQVLTLSGIGEKPGVAAKRIPAGEVMDRADYELDSNLLTLVDCATTLRAFDCQNVAMWLAKKNYRVIAVGLPSWSGPPQVLQGKETDAPRRRLSDIWK